MKQRIEPRKEEKNEWQQSTKQTDLIRRENDLVRLLRIGRDKQISSEIKKNGISAQLHISWDRKQVESKKYISDGN